MFSAQDIKKTLFGGYVKNESKVMYNLCCKRAASIGHAEYVRTNGKFDLEKIYETDMKNFLVYLAFSDGKVQKEEARYISELLGKNLPDYVISDYADMWDLKSESIKENAPLSLAPFVRANVGGETGEISDEYYDLITLYVTTFNYIGNDLISCNNDIRQGEIEALSSYVQMLRDNIDLVKEEMQEFVPKIEYKKGSTAVLTDDMFAQLEQDIQERYNKVDTADASDAERQDSKKKTELENNDTGKQNTQNNASDDGLILGKSYRREKLEEQEKETETEFVGQIKEADESVTLEQLLQELNDLTGMESVKNEVNNLVNLMKICKIRQERGLACPPTTNHLVFLGNPGTGKTTVARILSKIYHSIGVLSRGQLVEVDRSGLVAGYMGQTGIKVMEVVEKAKGGVLFIDEAYALSANKGEGDFGQEAIDVLNKAMEDYKDDLIVIAAGYHEEMQSFLDANPGLRSRFNRTIEFPNYSADDLMEIMLNRAKKLDYTFTDEAKEYAHNVFFDTLSDPPENFGNARSVRNYLDNIMNRQANRLISETTLNETILTTIEVADLKDVKLQ